MALMPVELCYATLASPVAAPSGRRVPRRRAVVRCAATAPAPMGEKTEYRDGPLERAFMGLFARKMEKFAGRKKKPDPGGEEEKKAQQEAVREVLLSMLPPGAPEQFKKLFPPTRWACEFNAALTVPFFHWLVGPSEVIEVEVDGVKQRSGVLIKKCRYLENSGCVGMCVNMCKIPTQSFFTDEFGLPLTMNPNFEDMSCEMIYGQVPPPLEEDPVSKQPCYPSLCSISTPSAAICPKIQN
ncbi:beta-carotene isomerase D27, chloroplastic [Hordeum vulgare]|nr:beta-carotene isomerase D27, chloroplastic [Hordeum vulgare]